MQLTQLPSVTSYLGEQDYICIFNNVLDGVRPNLQLPDLKQCQLQSHFDTSVLIRLKSVSSLRDQARLSTLAIAHTGAWHRATPNPKLGLSMSREEFVIAVRVFLGIPLFSLPPNVSKCSCGHILDVFGDHLLSCRNRSLRINAMMLYMTYSFIISFLATRARKLNNVVVQKTSNVSVTCIILIF